MQDSEERDHLQIELALSDAYEHLHRTIAESFATQNASADELRGAHELLSRLSDARLSNAAKNATGLTNQLEKLAGSVPGMMQSLNAAKKHSPGYETGSFQCKSDCDRCLARASTITEKCLCLALFTRCVLKG